MNLSLVLIGFGIILLALSIHEAAHAWTADKLGDPTARMLGRISINPLVHIDPIGTVILPLIAIWSGFPIIGWAKPVPVNVSRLRNPRRDFMLVAAAGPISNLLQAVVFAVAFRLVTADFDVGPVGFRQILAVAVSTNVVLALFNLIPVPPLDGGNVLLGLLPPSAARVLDGFRTYGFIILYALMLTGILGALIFAPADWLTTQLLL